MTHMEREEKLLANVASASTGDLLDRVTAYRAGMESVALEMIEKELHRRGVTARQIAEHRESCEQACIYLRDGVAAMCSFCRKPAIREGWGWHRIMGVVPIMPRWLRWCADHGV